MKHLLIPFLLIMTGCGVPTKYISRGPGGKAQGLADKECAKRERFAIYRPDNIIDSRATYECVVVCK
jgi:hypothetical protein